jgi:adenine-specific DNA-methyltransferase
MGIQDQFQAKRHPTTYRYDSSLDPALSWDEQRDRDLGEWLIGLIGRAAKEGERTVFESAQEWKGGGVLITSSGDAIRLLGDLSKPFLNWAGKSERQELRVSTVPLFIHERHSTKAVLDGIRYRRARGLTLDLFGDTSLDIRENLEAYEHKGPWQNRMILGDSTAVMNSLLEYEALGGQVQMIYIDPPYGVKFGSNFQPFVRKRDVKHGGDEDMTREPEMVKAYRDTWELGLHSYLTYLRDRLMVARDLLHESGSVFVQISDENLHHVREVMDEVFGAANFCGLIAVVKTSGLAAADQLAASCDYLVWFAKNKANVKYRQLYLPKESKGEGLGPYSYMELRDGTRRPLTREEREGSQPTPDGARRYRIDNLTKPGPGSRFVVEFEGRKFEPGNRWWGTTPEGMRGLAERRRLAIQGNGLWYLRFWDDFPLSPLTNLWTDTSSSFLANKLYVVQTVPKIVERCVLMTTEPGDLVLDPTCGSGTTAYVAEQWGRRWITCDTSRVPLALARQRLLTATFAYYELKDPRSGPAGGFVYKRRQNRKGEEVGGLMPRVTMKCIANNDPPAMEILVDRPEEISGITRVTGPFVVEATIAPVQALESESAAIHAEGGVAGHIQRMIEVLRQSKTLHLPRNRELVLAGVRQTADTEYLHAEAREGDRRVAIVFGPQDGAVSAALVYEAGREAHYLKYDRLYFFGFAIEPNARAMIEDERKLRIPATYVAVTPDVAMSDLLKTSRASEIFSVSGLPDFEVRKSNKKGPEGRVLYEVTFLGLDVFDPESLETESVSGDDVPCWMLDSDYDGMCFYAAQVFFPKTSAWDNLQRSLNTTFDASVWTHLSGTVSEPFALGDKRRIAVKVVDERGNELLRVKDVAE